jgi:hypothetical protein
MDGVKAAFSNFQDKTKEASGDEGASGGKHESAEGGAGYHSIHHLNHGEKHSVHKISHEGKAESSIHGAGEGGGTCPLCGQSV